MALKTGIFFNPHKIEAVNKLPVITEKYLGMGIEVLFKTSTEESSCLPKENPDFITVMGGDGSVLRALPIALKWDIPVVGVNFGKFGFLTRFNLEEILKNYKNQLFSFGISERSLLHAEILLQGKKRVFSALNDVVFIKGNTNKIENIDISFNGKHFSTIAADGAIVSTPTGSTAYSLSLGGAIIMPEVRCLEFNPIAPHSIAVCPLILSENTKIKLREQSGKEMQVSVDGLPWVFAEEVEISISEKKFKLACPLGDDLPGIISSKLFWGRRG